MDQKLFLLINRQWARAALDKWMAVASSLDFWLPLLVLAALLTLWRGGFRARAFLAVAAVTLCLADGVVANGLKRFTNRPRPADIVPGVRLVDLAKATPRTLAVFKPVQVRDSKLPPRSVPGRSFPSSHTSNTMALAMLAWLFYPRRGWWSVLAVLVTAYSRVYTGAHWPSHVVASLFLGAGVGAGCGALAELGWQRWGSWLFPQLAARHPSLFTTAPTAT